MENTLASLPGGVLQKDAELWRKPNRVDMWHVKAFSHLLQIFPDVNMQKSN